MNSDSMSPNTPSPCKNIISPSIIQITLHPLYSNATQNKNNKQDIPKEDNYKEESSKFSRKRSIECDTRTRSNSIGSAFKRSRILKINDLYHESNAFNAIWHIPQMIHTYDELPTSLKSNMMTQLLKRSPHSTLQLMNTFIKPILKHDFLSTCPIEISRRVIRYLGAFTLAKASCVNKRWKFIIDHDHIAWKQLLLRDGYQLTDPLDPSLEISNYKKLYARHHTLKQNWRKGRAIDTTFRGHDKSVVTCLQFDNEKIVSGADDSHINIYCTATGKKRMTLEGHEGGVWALQYIGHTLVTGSTDRRVRVWDMDTGKCTHIFNGHTSTIRCLLITKPPNKTPFIISGSRDSTLRVWKLPNPKDEEGHFYGGEVNPYFVHSLVGHRQSVRAIAAHHYTLVSGSYDNTVRVWDIKTGRSVHILEGHTQKVYSVVIDPERNLCMSGSMDSSIRIWDLATGDCIKKLEGHSVLVGLLGLSPQYLVSAAADSILRVWSPDTGVCQYALSGHTNSITCFQHDNTKIISGSEGGLKMWDIKTGKFIRDLITDVEGVWRVAFDGRRCIAAIQKSNDTSFKILDFGVYNM